MKFTPEEDAELIRLYNEGRSFSEIGAALGRTKNSAISRSRKLKLPSRGHLHICHMAQRTALMRHNHYIPSSFVPRAKSAPKPTKRKPPMSLRVVTAPDSKPVPIMERTGCCYPTTEKGPHLFCNAPTNSGDYCEFHYHVMYRVRAA